MDVTTIIGIVLSVVLVVYGAVSSGGIGAINGLWDFASFIITFGGTVATFISTYTIDQLKIVGKVASKAFKSPHYDSKATIASIIELANIARKEGLLALEEVAAKIENPFMQKAVNLMVDGTDPVLLKDILEAEIGATESRHQEGAGMFEAISAIGPAFGMLGTLVGLINMLNNLEDSAALGPGMAVALVTTLYGSIISNVIANPIVAKLKTRSGEEVMQMELILEGILSIHGGENPHIIQEKLNSFLSRTALNAAPGKDKKGKGGADNAEEE